LLVVSDERCQRSQVTESRVLGLGLLNGRMIDHHSASERTEQVFEGPDDYGLSGLVSTRNTQTQ
jgi:hypothetical protein